MYKYYKKTLFLFLLMFLHVSLQAQYAPGDDLDGDGIINSLDIDDDNDGISDCSESISGYFDFTGGLFTNRSIESTSYIKLTTQLTNSSGTLAGTPVGNAGGDLGIAVVAGVGKTQTIQLSTNNPVQFVAKGAIGSGGVFTNDEEEIYTVPAGATLTLTDPNDQIQIWDGTAWVSGPTVYTANSIRFRVNVAVAGTSIASGAGTYQFVSTPTTSLSWTQTNTGTNANGVTMNFGFTCADIDTDGDGIPNRLDLDSDGDGCSDAKESQVTPSSALVDSGSLTKAKFSFVSPTNDANGDGLYDGSSFTTYSLYALNSSLSLCPELDGDGIPDIVDIDDDNDGILDAVESPNCFYTATEAAVLTKVSTPLPNDDGVNIDLPFMRDGTNTSVAASNNIITAGAATNGSVIYNLGYTAPVRLTNIIQYGSGTWGAGATGRIEASSDGTSWVSLMSAATAATAATNTFTVNQNAGLYKYYRLVKVAGTTTPTFTVYELSGTADSSTYVPSANPKPTCTGSDLDGDGKYNHQDLDSDGDGCSDAKEATVTPSASLVADGSLTNAKFSFISPTNDANNDGLFDGATQTTYNKYALSNAINACTDTDGDGILDLVDIDDDNDGIVDAVESPNCFYSLEEMVRPVSVTSDFAFTNLANVYDALIGSYATMSTTNQAIAGKVIFEMTYNQPIQLSDLTIQWGGTAYSLYTISGTNTIKLQGWNGTSWLDLGPVETVNYIVKKYNVTQNPGSYLKYRVLGVSGAIGESRTRVENITGNILNYVPSLNPRSTCTGSDPDGDGKYNHQDLDSDNDGCSDAKEAQIISSSLSSSGGLANAVFNTAVGTNGLPDIVETSIDSNIVNYDTSYYFLATNSSISGCLDTDGDGLSNYLDLDSDNDGVTDVDESWLCSNNLQRFSISNTFSRSSTVGTVADGWTLSRGNIDIYIMPGTTIPSYDAGDTNFTMYRDVPTVPGKQYVFYFSHRIQTQTFCTGEVTVSDALSPSLIINKKSFVDTSTSNPLITNDKIVFFAVSTSSRITIASTSGENGNLGDPNGWGSIFSIFSFGEYSKCEIDTDGDGIPNYLDLDSDGDGCSDAVEANVLPNTELATVGSLTKAQFPTTSSFGTNGLANVVETSTDSGSTSYSSSYNRFAIDNQSNVCTDSDGDDLGDLIDLDDDNDGILDTVESICSSPSVSKTGVTINSELTYSSFGTNINGMIDGLDGTSDYTIYNPTSGTGNIAGYVWMGFVFPSPVRLDLIEFSNYSTGANSGMFLSESIYNIEVSRDGTNWFVIAENQTLGDSSTPILGNPSKSSLKFYIPNNQKSYKYYRIRGLTHTLRTGTWEQEAYFRQVGCAADTDGDGIGNELDLDSDNDGCLDAIEGAANIVNSQIVLASGTVSAGTGSTAANGNLCASASCVNTQGLPQFATLPSGYSNTTGQAIGDSQNASIAICTPLCIAPVINTQPQSTQNVAQNGTPANLTVSATGSSLTYQWYSNTANSNTGGTLISGANTASYTPPTTALGTMYYYVVVSSSSCTTTSNVSTVVVSLFAFCYKPGIADAGTTYPTQHGITSLGRAGSDNGNWPMIRQSAWTVLEAKTKGFVVNRVKFNGSNLPVADDGTTLIITSPIEGMMVYDTTNNCLKLYTSTDGGTTFGWYCVSTQTCPD